MSKPDSQVHDASTPTNPGPATVDRHQYSCMRCRSRKTKCDRLVTGCTPCQKAGVHCVYSGRHLRKTQQGHHKQLVRRLAAADSGSKTTSTGISEYDVYSSQDEDDKLIPRELHDSSFEAFFENGQTPPGRLFVAVAKRTSRFVNSRKAVEIARFLEVFNAALAMKDEDNADTTQNSEIKSEQPLAAMSDNTSRGIRLLNMPTAKQDLRSYHPPSKVQAVLWDSYTSNVDVLIKILHKPTVQKIFENLPETLGNLRASTEALVFAIYYAAVTTLPTEDCIKLYGQPQPVLQQRYQHALEIALVQAEWMTTQEIDVLQAIVLLIVCTLQTNLRATWMLLGIAIDIAQAMGLHREGTYFKLPIFVVEVRRRIWWALCVLDDRVSRECGLEVHVPVTMDTKAPSHLNDVDMDSSSRDYSSYSSRTGFTEMTMSLVKIERAEFNLKLKMPPQGRAPLSNEEVESLAREKIKRIEDTYLKHIDRSTHIGRLCYIGTRLIMADIWKFAYDHCLRYSIQEPAHVKEGLLRYNTEVLEITHQFPDSTDQYWWFFACKGPQWNAMAYLLTELRYHTKGVVVDRAWEVLDTVFRDLTHDAADKRLTGILLKRSKLWKALLKLCEQQRHVRTYGTDHNQPEIPNWYNEHESSRQPEIENNTEWALPQNELVLDDEFLGSLPDCSEDSGWGMLDYFLQHWQSDFDGKLEGVDSHELNTLDALNW